MLYNRNWDNKTLFSDFIPWLLEQNPNEEYDFTNSRNCVIAKYLRTKGFHDPIVDPYVYRDGQCGARSPLPPGLNDVANGGEERRTYGTTLKRALAWQSNS